MTQIWQQNRPLSSTGLDATAADATILESGGTKGFHPLTPYKPVKVDRIIKDGETVRYAKVIKDAGIKAR